MLQFAHLVSRYRLGNVTHTPSMRTTLKETTIHDTRTGNFASAALQQLGNSTTLSPFGEAEHLA